MREMEYKRKVDKRLIPTCNIMGVNIAAINMEWLVDYLEKNISEIKGDYICVSNVHTTVTLADNDKKIVKLIKETIKQSVLKASFLGKKILSAESGNALLYQAIKSGVPWKGSCLQHKSGRISSCVFI